MLQDTVITEHRHDGAHSRDSSTKQDVRKRLQSLEDCNNLTRPVNGSLGTCWTNGSLPHNQSCELECDAGFTLSGEQ
eukprot:SAG22_NODE_502_length_9704_cov_23.436439_1_plen_76_part_10